MGRSSQNQLRVWESSVSRVHSSIIVTRRGIYVRDESSSLGTYVNGQRVTAAALKSGDRIRIVASEFEFREK